MSESWKKSLKFVGNDALKIHLKLNDPSKALMGNCKWTQSNYNTTSNKMNCELMLTYDTPALWQTGSRNLTGPKTLPTIWHTYMKLVTKYQIPVINSC